MPIKINEPLKPFQVYMLYAKALSNSTKQYLNRHFRIINSMKIKYPDLTMENMIEENKKIYETITKNVNPMQTIEISTPAFKMQETKRVGKRIDKIQKYRQKILATQDAMFTVASRDKNRYEELHRELNRLREELQKLEKDE